MGSFLNVFLVTPYLEEGKQAQKKAVILSGFKSEKQTCDTNPRRKSEPHHCASWETIHLPPLPPKI